MRFFKGLRNIVMNVSQIIIVGLLFPAFSIICYLFSADNPGSAFWSNVFSLLSEIPLFKLVCGLIAQYLSSFSAADVAEITVTVFLKAFPETVLVAICVHFFVQLFTREWDALNISLMRKKKTTKRQLWVIPILPTFLGIFASTIIVNLLELFKDQTVIIISEIAVVIIMLIGIRMLFGRKFYSKAFSLITVLKFFIDGVFAIITSCYLAMLFLVSAGFATDFKAAVGLVLIMSGITILAAIVLAIAHGLFDKK